MNNREQCQSLKNSIESLFWEVAFEASLPIIHFIRTSEFLPSTLSRH